MNPTATEGLAPAEIHRFHRDGVLGPFTAVDPDEMAAIREHIDAKVLPTTGPDPTRNEHARHLDSRTVFELVAHGNIVDRLRSILGDDLIIWSSNFWNKEPGGDEVPWHQDINFWPIEPLVNVSCWLAIDEVTVENSCVQVIPGSHRELIEHVPGESRMGFREEARLDAVDLSKVVDMELKAGQFFFFNERMLHHSNANHSSKRRLGLAARYTIPQVRVLNQDDPPLFPGHRCLVLSGEDRFGFNRLGSPS